MARRRDTARIGGSRLRHHAVVAVAGLVGLTLIRVPTFTTIDAFDRHTGATTWSWEVWRLWHFGGDARDVDLPQALPRRILIGMDRAEVDRWLRSYVEAWKTYDPDLIGSLFADDIQYRYHPYDDPVVGRHAIVASWVGESETPGVSARDAPGTYDADYAAIAVDGDVAVATGVTTYSESPGGTVDRVFHNCFVMRFDGAMRCTEFTEWYMERPRAAAPA